MAKEIKKEVQPQTTQTTEPEEPKVFVRDRAVPIEDMFNNLSDRMDMVLMSQQEIIKRLDDLTKLAKDE